MRPDLPPAQLGLPVRTAAHQPSCRIGQFVARELERRLRWMGAITIDPTYSPAATIGMGAVDPGT